MKIKELPHPFSLQYSSEWGFDTSAAVIRQILRQMHEDIGLDPVTLTENNWLSITDCAAGKIACFAVVVKRGSGCRLIRAIYTAPEYRRQGLATALVDHVFGFGSGEDVIHMDLKENQTDGIAFAKAFEFKAIHKVEGHTTYERRLRDHWNNVQATKEKDEITSFKEYVHWEPGGDSVTLDGSFTASQLETIARFMRRGGPGHGGCNHKDL